MAPTSAALALTLLLGVLFGLTPLGTDAFLPAMPAIAAALDSDARTVQFAVTTFFLGVAAGQLVWGPLSDRYGRRPALFSALAVALLASLGAALAHDAETIVALRFVQGLGMSGGPVVSRTIARDLFDREHAARLLARMSVVFGLVPILAPLAGGALVGWGWRALFYFFACVAAALGAWSYLALRETAPAIGTRVHVFEHLRRFRGLLVDRRFLAPASVLLSVQAAIAAFVSNSAFVLVQGLGQSPRGFAMLFALVMLGHMCGAWYTSRRVLRDGIDRLVRRGVRLGAAAALVLAALAWSGIAHWGAVVAPMVVFMFAASLVIPNAIAAALSPFPRVAGAASSLLGACQFVASAAMSVALALLFDGSALPMASAIALAALLAAAAERTFFRRARAAGA